MEGQNEPNGVNNSHSHTEEARAEGQTSTTLTSLMPAGLDDSYSGTQSRYDTVDSYYAGAYQVNKDMTFSTPDILDKAFQEQAKPHYSSSYDNDGHGSNNLTVLNPAMIGQLNQFEVSTPGGIVSYQVSSNNINIAQNECSSINIDHSEMDESVVNEDEHQSPQYPNQQVKIEHENMEDEKASSQSVVDDELRRFKCNVCQKHLKSLKGLKEHKRKLHGIMKEFTCKICAITFNSSQELMDHICTNNPAGKLTSEEMIHNPHPEESRVCKVPESPTSDIKSEHSPAGTSIQSTPSPPYSTLTSPTNKKKFTKQAKMACDICGKTFADRISVDIHRVKHIEEELYPCDMCDVADGEEHEHHLAVYFRIKFFTDDNQHILDDQKKEKEMLGASINHTDQQIVPVTSSNGDGTPVFLKERSETVVKIEGDQDASVMTRMAPPQQSPRSGPGPIPKPFKCDVCHKGFTDQAKVDLHYKTNHTEEPSFQCDLCDKAFFTKWKLQRHALSHLDVKPHACTMCPRSFAERGKLEAHIRTHTGNKPFSCSMCDKSFTVNSQLNIHMRRVHATEHAYTCADCGKGFLWPSGLEKHRRKGGKCGKLKQRQQQQSTGSEPMDEDDDGDEDDGNTSGPVAEKQMCSVGTGSEAVNQSHALNRLTAGGSQVITGSISNSSQTASGSGPIQSGSPIANGSIVHGSRLINGSIVRGSHIINVNGSHILNGSIANGSQIVNGSMVSGSQIVNGPITSAPQIINGSIVSGSQLVNGSLVSGSQIVNGSLVSGSQMINGNITSGSQVINRAVVSGSQLINSSVINGAQVLNGHIVGSGAHITGNGTQVINGGQIMNNEQLMASHSNRTSGSHVVNISGYGPI